MTFDGFTGGSECELIKGLLLISPHSHIHISKEGLFNICFQVVSHKNGKIYFWNISLLLWCNIQQVAWKWRQLIYECLLLLVGLISALYIIILKKKLNIHLSLNPETAKWMFGNHKKYNRHAYIYLLYCFARESSLIGNFLVFFF